MRVRGAAADESGFFFPLTMWDWIRETVLQYTAQPLYQGIAAALGTFILEDPTTVICGLLVAQEHMMFATAMIGVSSGIAIGDFGLYLIGRFLGPQALHWRLMHRRHINDAQAWFNDNLVSAIVLSRFVPGSRLPTYIAAGVCKASPAGFLATAVCASVVWTFLLLSVTVWLGEKIMPLLGGLKWPVAIGAIALFGFLQWRYSKRQEAWMEGREEPPASFFEFWPPPLFYAPVAVYYLWLSIRYGGLTVPTVSNPKIYSGGMVRESKSEILGLVPESISECFAPPTALPCPADLSGDELMDEAKRRMAEGVLELPVVAKPDHGQRGDGVRPIATEGELRAYVEAFPRGSTIILQELVPYKNEAGVMWYRYPDEAEGHIFSVTAKEFPVLTGDGERTLKQLIHDDPRAHIIKETYMKRHKDKLDVVVPKGETFPLVFAGNHKQGCIFKDGIDLLTPELERKINEIAMEIPEFYFGRFDIRYRDRETFMRGEEFSIVEINGASAEATHIWDATMTLVDAYWTLFRQFRILFRIGAANRKRGYRPMGAIQVVRDLFAYLRTAREYPAAH